MTIVEEARLVQKYKTVRLSFLIPTLSARRFAPRPISPVARVAIVCRVMLIPSLTPSSLTFSSPSPPSSPLSSTSRQLNMHGSNLTIIFP